MMFKRFLEHNNIKDKPIPNSYPQLQGKVEAYNKIVNSSLVGNPMWVFENVAYLCRYYN